MGRKSVIALLISGLVVCGSTLAGWHDHYYHDHYYDHHYYYHDRGDDLAAGLIVGGVIGLAAGAAIASNSQPTYVTHYYDDYPTCYKVKAWSKRICDYHGCYIKTAWRTVCD